MTSIAASVNNIRRKSREKRAQIFHNFFSFNSSTKILDFGSEDGSHIASILQGFSVSPENVFIADINQAAVNKGKIKYGFHPVLISESGRLPFDDGFFDIVFCSSVIEHVTVSKIKVWKKISAGEFKRQAGIRQKEFAQEIIRLGKYYYVQTPNKWFFMESHSWLPLIGWLPRAIQILFLRLSNKIWIKKTSPDWNLLSIREMRQLFPDAEIVPEKWCSMIKSIMAVKKMK